MENKRPICPFRWSDWVLGGFYLGGHRSDRTASQLLSQREAARTVPAAPGPQQNLLPFGRRVAVRSIAPIDYCA